MKVHFIAIGGSAMHNLAIALHKKGYDVSGSDDEIFDPSRKNLMQHGLFPENTGWQAEKIHKGLDAVILGMHARVDNPELIKARELGLKIYSYPEYLYEQSKNKTRIVIGGSHGKTTITAMVLHVLNTCGIETDYMVGAQLEGFEVMVKLSEDAAFIVIEGDEYLSSPVDPRPKFHIYKPHIALISGIAWDHINVFPTFEMYLDQFRRFIYCIEEGGKLIYCKDDKLVKALCEEESTASIYLYPYGLPDYVLKDERVYYKHKGKLHLIQLIGKHNLMNINGARHICMQMGIDDDMFFDAIRSFKGASRRMEKIFEAYTVKLFRDFAHAPSKIKASIEAVKEFHPTKKLIACIELHTYSSLSENFLDHYKDTMEKADEALVFYDPHAVRLKKLPELDPETIIKSFNKSGLRVFTDTQTMFDFVMNRLSRNTNLLFMSSGNFGGLKFKELIAEIEKTMQ